MSAIRRGLLALLVMCTACSSARTAPVADGGADAASWDGSVASAYKERNRPVIGTRGMVVSESREASEWGAEILRQGGNAVDAAVATAFMLAVTRPHFGSLGGGGFMVFCPKPAGGRAQPCQALDYREEAPGAATRDLYLRDGKARTDLSQDGALASGVPGVPAGLLLALEKFGTLPRQKLLARPIRDAREGIRVSSWTEVSADDRWKAMNDETRRIWGCDGKPCPPGTVVRQPDLARVLTEISRKGAPGFYSGWVARKISEGLRAAGGIMTEQDLGAYRPKLREPVTGHFRGMEVVSMPPPSSGGGLVVQMLGYAERADSAGAFAGGYGSAPSVHAVAQGMSLAFADRAKYYGDPDVVQVPLAQLLAPAYLDERWKSYDAGAARIPEGAGDLGKDHPNTTHFSVIDREGNAVAITTTVNDNFGSGFTPPGTGVVMNNQMDDFSIQPGVANMYGLVGAEANAVGPRKRPLSSMSPTVVRDAQGVARLVLGAAGGPRIPTAVFHVILNRYRWGMALPDAVAAARFHHQWKPRELRLERYGFPAEVREALAKRGWALGDVASTAVIHALERYPNGRVWGGPDHRGEGVAVAE
jgi:gamma-glutamyltranspeptidase / glutathione hydrolase